MADRLDEVMHRAVAEGLLPASAARPGGEQRPWPVVLLTALGAWLAAIPLLGVVAMLLGPLINNPVGPYFAGLLLLAGAVTLLRSASVPLFVEQLAVPALLVGGGTLGFGVFRDLPHGPAALLLAAVAVALALFLRQAWLRVLLGVLAASLVGLALLEPRGWFRGHLQHPQMWITGHLLLLVVVLAPWWEGRWRGQGSALESLSAGWWLTTLAGLALLAGMTFLVGGAFGAGIVGEVGREITGSSGRRFDPLPVLQALSAVLALAGAGWVARAWPGVRHPALLLAALCAVALSWFMTTLGGVLLGLACLLVAQRWRLAAAAGVAAAWIVGAFYYALAWDLATKALVLVVAGVLVGVGAAWLRRPSGESRQRFTLSFDRRALWVGLSTVATLVIAVSAIWEKQALIERGQPVYVALAPVDPRSLMQGDYMRLNFLVPRDLLGESPLPTAQRRKVVAMRDDRGVATLVRSAIPGEGLKPGEFLFELTPKGGHWILVSDAWFFREGEGERWAQARYGEFRVDPEGRALLVGMADEQLQAIKP